MANLETLFIEIDGSATKATSGIDNLVGSLSALGNAVTKQLAPLREFSNILKTIRQNSDINVNGIGGITSAKANATTSGLKKATKAMGEYKKATMAVNFPKNNAGAIVDVNGNPINKNLPVWTNYYKGQYAYFADAQKKTASATKSATEQIQKQEKVMGSNAKVTGEAAKNTTVLAESTKQISKANVTVQKTHSATKGLLSQIGRIAKTMLIRQAIRSLMKSAQEGLQNYYQYSKEIGGQYATAMDAISSKSATARNQLGSALGALLTSVAPILNTIISLATAAANAVSMLFSLLGGSSTWSKAKEGMDSFGKSAGGAGGKVKELLADFDQLNIIASESGGGGGGGGGSFGNLFEEVQLPQWMIEWKPLIEALLAGTLGAIILPKIWEWVSKIFGLGNGTGAKVIKDVLDKLVGGDKNNSFNFDIKGLEDELVQLGLIKGELEMIEKSLRDINTYKLPDFAAAATQMGILAAAAMLGAPYIKTICDAIAGLKGGIGLFNIVGNLLSTVLGALAGSKKIKIELDRTEFDTFKEEFDAWFDKHMLKSVRINFDRAYYNNFVTVAKALDGWAETPYNKLVRLNFQAAYYNNFVTVARAFDAWAAAPYNKNVIISFDPVAKLKFDYTVVELQQWANVALIKNIFIAFNTIYYATYQAVAKTLDDWSNKALVKWIYVNFNAAYYNNFNAVATGLNTWAAIGLTKWIYVNFNSGYYNNYYNVATALSTWASIALYKWIYVAFNSAYYNNYYATALGLSTWAAASLTKWIYINFNSAYVSNFNTVASSLSDWANKKLYKLVYVGFDDNAYKNFWSIADRITKWANESLTKTISVVIDETTNKTTNSTSSGKGNTSTKTNTGLSWSLDKGLTWNGENVLDLALNALGFASGGFPMAGDLFIANEAGAELVGSINGRTAVANQEQIIEGIQRGVSEANSEQTALLRQQNDLLRSILQKDNSVRLNASAALGRTVQQSLNMYGNTGG